jgi:Rps23 Pro-64 3,4-dihydroxylase Tpa1-like proline 4-hydroxylase
MGQISQPTEALPIAGGLPLQGDYVVIDGLALGFEELLNKDFFSPKKIESLHQTFISNKPFPHIVLEGLFSPRLLELMEGEFDKVNWSDWRHFDNVNELKRGSMPNTRFGNATQLYFNTIHSGFFVNFIKQITGIPGLIPDPELYSGGLHDIPTGGKFAMHTDFNQHSVTKLDNRLVFITYLNKGWQRSYGGALELWDVETNTCQVEVDPVFGRSVLFLQSSRSLHGHPKPVNAPGGRSRRSAAAYFYSNGRNDGDSPDFHTTLFPMPARLTRTDKIVNVIKYLTPPVLVDAVRKAKSTLR